MLPSHEVDYSRAFLATACGGRMNPAEAGFSQPQHAIVPASPRAMHPNALMRITPGFTLPLPPQNTGNGSPAAAFAVTVYLSECRGGATLARSAPDQPVYVLRGIWRDGQWEDWTGAAHLWHMGRAERLLEPTAGQIEQQRRALTQHKRINKQLLGGLAITIFLLCLSGVASLSVWHHRQQAVERATVALQREAEQRISSASSAAAERHARMAKILEQQKRALSNETLARLETERLVEQVQSDRALEARAREAAAMILRDDVEPAMKIVAEVLEQYRATGQTHAETAMLLSVGAALSQKHHFDSAERFLKDALIKASDPAHPNATAALDAHVVLAWMYRVQHRQLEAIDALLFVLRAREQDWHRYDERLIPLLQELATLRMMLQQYDQVESLCARILSIRAGIQQVASPQAVDDLALMSMAMVRQGKMDEAAAICKRILLIEPALDVEQRARLTPLLAQLAHHYVEKGRYSQAMILLERALASRQPGTEINARDISDWRLLARLYVRERRYSQAEKIYLRLIESRESSTVGEDPILADDASELAELYERRNLFGEAEALYKLAMEIREKVLGPYHLDVAKSAIHLADLYRVQGKIPQAEALYELAREIRARSAEDERL